MHTRSTSRVVQAIYGNEVGTDYQIIQTMCNELLVLWYSLSFLNARNLSPGWVQF